jgi:hypothetical protein
MLERKCGPMILGFIRRIILLLPTNIKRKEYLQILRQVCGICLYIQKYYEVHATPSIEGILRAKKKVKILTVYPVYKDMPEVEKLVDTTNLSQDIPRTLNTLNQLHISEDERHNLRIRIHDLVPTHTMIIVDPNYSYYTAFNNMWNKANDYKF